MSETRMTALPLLSPPSHRSLCGLALAAAVLVASPMGSAAESPAPRRKGEAQPNSVQEALTARFAAAPQAAQLGEAPTSEVPDFQKHVSPLLGRLGCNGRACHGSFQGQGGFQLSLFGYDFKEDYRALLDEDTGRVDVQEVEESLILAKPVDEDMHEGGQRFEQGGWEYWVLRNWIQAGAPFDPKRVQQLERLEVVPSELQFTAAGQTQQLQAIAHWADGAIEDVTCLCRFQTNDASIAEIDESGLVTSGSPGDTHVVVSYDNAVVPVAALRPLSENFGDNYPDIAANTEVDRLILDKLRKLGIVPSDLCDDATFLRRASLDVTGTLPSPEAIQEFVADTAPDKRARKIDELLAQPAYAAQWTTFLCDITGNNDDQLRNFLPNNVRVSDQWYQWIYQRLADNVPYDDIVEGIVTANSRLPDESYREYCEALSDICRDPSGEMFAERPGLVYYWARRNFQSSEDRAIGFAYAFLGVRIQCAQCHKHPFDQWSKSDFEQFERLFTNVQARQNTLAPDARKEYDKMVAALGVDKKLRGNQLRRELVPLLKDGKSVPLPELVVSPPRPQRGRGKNQQPAQAPQAKLLGGATLELTGDVRPELMAWLRSEDNPYFARAITNRIWAHYFGAGIVNPPDDLNLANAPSNAALLDYLADGFRTSGFDLHWLHRQILNSDAYQRSWVPNETNRLDQHNFSHSLLRRLPAETTYDAVRTALAKDALADESRNLALPRAITKAGASARNNGRDDEAYALTVFGRSIRESNCDCDRSSEPSLLQKVFLVNDSAVQKWLTDPKTSWVEQMADQYDWPSANAPQQTTTVQVQKLIDRFQEQLEEVNQRIRIAKRGDNPRQLEALQKRRRQMLQRARTTADKLGVREALENQLAVPGSVQPQSAAPENDPARITGEQAQWIAEQAYLRTLSRQPTHEETERVVTFLTSAQEPREGVEGVLWSLINTKEFILNH